jgi:CheY-like chemotaxis protein
MRAGPARPVVLVVEDDALVRSDIVSEFCWQGWQVLDTSTGEDALVLTADHHIDAVFTDIKLDGPMSGWQVAEAAREANPDLPVIYTSGNAADLQRQVPGSLFFGKPYDPAAVIEACGSLVGIANE